MYGFCYDAARRCTGNAQPGTRILRDTMDDLVPELGDLGIYNCRPTRTGSSYSLHAEGRAWDCAIPANHVELGNRTAQFFVDAAPVLGVQRVIWGFGPNKAPKEWDSRQGERMWEAYSGPSHDDHIHVELCWRAALDLTVQEVRDAYRRYWEGQEEGFLMALSEQEQQAVLGGTKDAVAKLTLTVLDTGDNQVKSIGVDSLLWDMYNNLVPADKRRFKPKP